jgi:hypothetical protein
VGERGKGNRIQRDCFAASGLTKFFANISLPHQDAADDLARSAKAMTIDERQVLFAKHNGGSHFLLR